MKNILWVIVPCFNEENVLPITSNLLLKEIEKLKICNKIAMNSKILFVDDGSNDNTWQIIQRLSVENNSFVGIRLSRNRGHQNAVLSGLMEAKDKADITISIDCDGQDDISAMENMINAYYDGCQIVYGVRSNRDSDSLFKRTTAQGFYKFMNFMGADLVYNHADYRLVSSRVLEAFSDFKEVNLFLRGMFPLVGFKSTSVYYERHERLAGKSHYSLSKMVKLAFDGITSLSIKPINVITGFGMLVAGIGFVGIIWALINKLMGNTVSGWTSMICVICFLGGVQLLCTGIIGQYVGKVYMETKHRPRYIISERTYGESDELSEKKN